MQAFATYSFVRVVDITHTRASVGNLGMFTEIGKKAELFAKLQPSRARKIINAT